jgi:hypothetical protein
MIPPSSIISNFHTFECAAGSKQHAEPDSRAQTVSQLLFTMRDLNVTWPVFHFEDLSAFNLLSVHLTNLEVAVGRGDLIPYLLHLYPNLSSSMIRAGTE